MTTTLPRDMLFRAQMPGATLERAKKKCRAGCEGCDCCDGGDGEAGDVMVGHFAVFDRWTEIDSWWEGNFMERIAPGAFRKTFRENRDGIRVLFQHGRDFTTGDKPLGTIDELEEDDTGARYAVPLFDTGYVRELLPGLDAGVYGASFRFAVVREEIVQEPKASDYNPRGIPERTIREMRVSEFGPVTFPAYVEATAGLRSITDDIIMRTYAGRAEPERFARMLAEYSRAALAAPGSTTRTTDSDAPAEDAGQEPTSDARRDEPNHRPLIVTRNPNRRKGSA